MSDDEIDVPRYNKEDLLQQYFDIQDLNEADFNTSSTSLSFSDPQDPKSRLSFGLNERRTSLYGRDIENFISQSLEEEESFKKETYKKQIGFNKKSKPQAQQQRETVIGQISQPLAKKSMDRIRKNSFYEVEDYSVDQTIPQLQKIYESSLPLMQKNLKNTEKSKQLPYVRVEKQNQTDLRSRPHNFKMFSDKNNIKISKHEEKQSSQLLNHIPKKIQEKPVNFKEKMNQMSNQENKEELQRKILFKNKVQNNKPICFDCGGGHYYNQCTLNRQIARSSDLKCLNCKKQGHTARFCPDPKKCSTCGSIEHLARDCPSNQSIRQQKVCLNCNKLGHFAKQCTVPKKCYLCHQVGHEIKNCPKNKQNNPDRENSRFVRPLVCFNCRKQGHYANQCDQPLRCHGCNQEGHFTRDCPHAVRSISVMHMNLHEVEKSEQTQSLQKPKSEATGQVKNKSKFNFKKYFKSGEQSKLSKSHIQHESKSKKSQKFQRKTKQK